MVFQGKISGQSIYLRGIRKRCTLQLRFSQWLDAHFTEEITGFRCLIYSSLKQNERITMKQLIHTFTIAHCIALLLSLTSAVFAQPHLILHDIYYDKDRDGQTGTVATPIFVRDNLEYLETTPFDGLAVYVSTPSRSINASRYVFSSRRVNYTSIRDVLTPLVGLPFQSLSHNFAFVAIDRPADWFDDWSIPIQNFRDLARAIREAGLKGVFLDNEQYFSRMFNYPDEVTYKSKTLDEYRDQARIRGRQIMEAMISEFPDIEILVFHGPYVSSPNAPFWTPEPDRHPLFQRLDAYYELLGPFFVGLVEGKGDRATVIDGGSGLKHFRPEIDYELGYQFRKYDIASPEIDSPFIPMSLRSRWSSDVDLAYTLYDCPIRGEDMNPQIARETLVHALHHADKYVWFYPEANKFLRPPSDPAGAPIEWHDAIREAKKEVAGPPLPNPGSVTPSSGTGNRQAFSFNFKIDNGLAVTGASILISEGTRRENSCWMHYDAASNLFFLANDNITRWDSVQFGTTGSIRNSQCIALLGGSSVVRNGAELTLNFSLWFLDGGQKDVFLRASGPGYDSGYVPTSTWTVP